MKSPAASADLSSLPALKVLMRARAEGRMPHAVLLTGDDGELLARAAEQLAALHLGESEALAHADCFVLRPAKKSRVIDIKQVCRVVGSLKLTSISPRRVVLVAEPDRFNAPGANAFLKTLEEPPAGTLIVLHTTKYYQVIPTVLSRCLRFHIKGEPASFADPSWLDWLREFEKLLVRMIKGPASPNARVSEVFIPLYALCARFEVLLALFGAEALKVAPPPPPSDDDEDEAGEAHESSILRAVRTRMLFSVEEKIRQVGRMHPECGLQVAQAIGYLEQARARLELSYQVVAALEQFMLRTLRTFAQRPRPEPAAQS